MAEIFGLTIEPTDRVVSVGPTGCGKSFLMDYMLDFYPDVVKVDFKHSIERQPDDLEATDLKSLYKQLDRASDTGQHVLYRVPKEHKNPANARQLDYVAEWCLERATPESPSILYYDELVFVAGASDFWKRAPHFYYAITTGRGSGLGVWGCVQRPVGVPLIIFSESNFRSTFALVDPDDQRIMEYRIGKNIPWTKLEQRKHSFVIGGNGVRPQFLILEPTTTKERVA